MRTNQDVPRLPTQMHEVYRERIREDGIHMKKKIMKKKKEPVEGSSSYTSEEERIVKKRLMALGYLD